MGAVLMALPVYMLAQKSRFPCTGAFSIRVGKGRSWLFANGFIARDTGVKKSYLPARTVQACIEKTAKDAITHRDRRGVLEEVWSSLFDIPRAQLGRNRGADMSLIMAAGDEDGVNLCTISVSGLWGKHMADQKWLPILPKGHPLFQVDGLSEEFPGSLHIAHPPKCVVATAQPLFPMLPQEAELWERLGVKEL